MTPLALGPEVIQRLIPHRRPFLFVDSVTGLRRQPAPTLRASRVIAADEDIFACHFPGLALWPGVYTIEGLGQTTLLLHAILAVLDAHPDRAADLAAVFAALGTAPIADRAPLGVSGQVDVKLVRPVYGGCRLDYEVTRTHIHERFGRFDVEAQVAGRVVARGTMTGALASWGGAR
jgi:3-hydroxyacyl-[acyl-carrier-protein] dehydratase